jgi:hypothetical protein
MRREKTTTAVYAAALAVFGLCSPAPALAGTGFGKVEIEHAGWFGNGNVYFYTTVHADEPACNNYRKRWALNIKTVEGRVQYAFLLQAETTGKEIRVWGTGACDLESNSETVGAVGSAIDYSQHP